MPNKHAHPDKTVLAAATELLRYLRRHQVVRFDELRQHLPSDNSSEYLLAPALSLLYLLGLVEYQSTVDSFIYTGS